MLRLLYVDDNADLRELAKLALEQDGGVEARTASSGGEALEVLRSFRADAVLLDVMMPVMDGPSVLARMRDDPRLAETPVIFITARAMPREAHRLRDLGAVAVIIKPYDPLGLAAEVRKALEPPPSDDPLLALRGRFQAQCGEDLAALRTARAAPNGLATEHFSLMVHRLCGMAGSFGRHDLSQLARVIDERLAQGRTPSRGHLDLLQAALEVVTAGSRAVGPSPAELKSVGV